MFKVQEPFLPTHVVQFQILQLFQSGFSMENDLPFKEFKIGSHELHFCFYHGYLLILEILRFYKLDRYPQHTSYR